MTMPKPKWRAALFTAQDLGFQLVDRLAGRKDIDLFVVTHRTERDDNYGYRSAIDICETQSIPYVNVTRISAQLISRLAVFQPDLIVSAYYPHVIPEAVQQLSRVPAVNLHPGILPYYRGRYPTPWYILNGEVQFGLAIHRLNQGIDTGPVLVQAFYAIAPDETGHGLYRKTMDYGTELLVENFDRLLNNEIAERPQSGVGTYYGTIERRFQVDWNRTCEEISRRVRVHARPYFPAYTFIFNRIVLINRVSRIDFPGFAAQGGGKILQVQEDGRFIVTCCDGCLLVDDFEVCPRWTDKERRKHLRAGINCET